MTGEYSIGGVEKTFAQMWATNLAWSTHNPATIVEDEGYVWVPPTDGEGDGIVSTPELFAAIGGNGDFVSLLCYTLDAPELTSAQVETGVAKLDYSNGQRYIAYRNKRNFPLASVSYRWLSQYDPLLFEQQDLPFEDLGGMQRVAVAHGPTLLAHAVNGAPRMWSSLTPHRLQPRPISASIWSAFLVVF